MTTLKKSRKSHKKKIKRSKAAFAAGVMDGYRMAWWSRHSTCDLAEAAARKYARQARRTVRTGGARSWSGFVRDPEGRITELRADGSVVRPSPSGDRDIDRSAGR